MNVEKGLTPLRVLRTFFRITAIIFLLVPFSFTVDDTGATWIMWRDSTLLAVTFVALALLMAGGWLYVVIRMKKQSGGDEERGAPSLQPYNIWGPMSPGSRAGLATAVFLIFGTIGPLNSLLTPPYQTLDPLEIIILTIASGGISACVILFGNRKILLVLSLALCLGVLFTLEPIMSVLSPHPPPSLRSPDGSVTLTPAQLSDFQAERTVVAGGGIVLLSLGYVMFIVLLTNEGRQRGRLQAEMSIARRIQLSLIPSGGITTGAGEAAGLTVPASEVGGDYFDFLELPDGRLAVFTADVAGHGVGAGILGAMTKSAFRAHIVHDPAPSSMLKFLNVTLAGLVERKMFITAAYLLLEPARRSARIATAGHPPLLHIDGRGTVDELRTPSLALGMDRNCSFTELDVPCARGDRFLLYTDGVVESASGSGEQFGQSRLKDLLTRGGDVPPVQTCEAIVRETEVFRGKKGAVDDLTVVAVRVG
jgi:serine phosphatase RsbU (regulator of sigma subunit)